MRKPLIEDAGESIRPLDLACEEAGITRSQLDQLIARDLVRALFDTQGEVTHVFEESVMALRPLPPG